MQNLKKRLLQCAVGAALAALASPSQAASNVTSYAGTYFDSVSGVCSNTAQCFVDFSKVRADQQITAGSCSLLWSTSTNTTIVTSVIGQSYTNSAGTYSFVDGAYIFWNGTTGISGNRLFSTAQITGIMLGVRRLWAPAMRFDLSSPASVAYFCTVMGPEMPQQ